jgi:hypothetical protein
MNIISKEKTMKTIFRLAILGFIVHFLVTSCGIYFHQIHFRNNSSYRITVHCNATDPTNFTLQPKEKKWIDSKVDKAKDLKIKINDSDFVSVSVFDHDWSEVTFADKDNDYYIIYESNHLSGGQ